MKIFGSRGSLVSYNFKWVMASTALPYVKYRRRGNFPRSEILAVCYFPTSCKTSACHFMQTRIARHLSATPVKGSRNDTNVVDRVTAKEPQKGGKPLPKLIKDSSSESVVYFFILPTHGAQ